MKDSNTDILVEYALQARALITEGKFFDKDGQPQEGTALMNKTLERLGLEPTHPERAGGGEDVTA